MSALPARKEPVPRPLSVETALLWLFGATLPFPVLGIPLNEFFTLSLSSLAGLAFATSRLARFGLRRLQLLALLMLLVFAATALPRHAVSSYALSLGALALAMSPLTSPYLSRRDFGALAKGLALGLALTLSAMLMTIVVQVLGLQNLLGELASPFVRPEMGVFLGYVRPAAGFSEPSHMAIFLAAIYVLSDLGRNIYRFPTGLKPTLVLAIVLSGSLSGILLFVVYAAAQAMLGPRQPGRAGWSTRTLAQALVGAAIAIATLAWLGPAVFDFTDDYAARLVKTQEDIETLNLVGSEASRVNAILALPEYWEAAGAPGFMFGTGYANYQDWLLSTYGHLNQSATFARGQIDNLLVAVFLSTGLIGLLAYLNFLVQAFGTPVSREQWPVMIFVVAVNFSYGYLISGLYWGLLFVLAAVGRYAAVSRSTPAARPHAAGDRPLAEAS